MCVYTSEGMDVHMDTRAHLVCIAVSLGLLKSSTLSFSLALRGFLLVFFFFSVSDLGMLAPGICDVFI